MKIIKSEVIGYCSGVSRAVQKLKIAIELGKKLNKQVYSMGQIIHNPHVLEYFENQGVKIIEEKDFSDIEPGIVVLRAHGVSDKSRRLFLDNDFFIFDATCPIVINEQETVFNAPLDSTIVIIGGQNHPEALALKSVETTTEKIIISSVDEITKIPVDKNLFVVIQSTYPSGKRDIIEDTLEKYANNNNIEIKFANDLCNSNRKRREAVAKLAKKCDCIIIVGGKNSSNTRGLYNYCKTRVRTFLISDVEDFTDEIFSCEVVGLATGTSTPLLVVEEVERILKRGKYEA